MMHMIWRSSRGRVSSIVPVAASSMFGHETNIGAELPSVRPRTNR